MSFDQEMQKLRGMGKKKAGKTDAPDSNEGSVGSLVSLRNEEVYSTDQVRVSFQEIEALAEQIKDQGQQQPIRVYPKDDQGYQIEVGERRWRACRHLGLPVQAIIIEPKVEVDRIISQLAENIGRQALEPVEEGVAFRRLRDEQGLSVTEIGRRVGYSKAVVSKRIALTDLPEALESLVMERQLLDLEIIGHLRQAFSQAPAAYERICKAIEAGEVVRRADVKDAIAQEKAGQSEPQNVPGLRLAESVSQRDPSKVSIKVTVREKGGAVKGTVRLDLSASDKSYVVIEGGDGELYEAPVSSLSLSEIT